MARTTADRTYLDHAATTPMVEAAREAMVRELSRTGNPSSLHRSGRAARRVVEEARESIASRVGAHPAELIFTSGGTESDNLAIKGAYWGRPDPARTRVVASAAEHHAVLDSVGWLGSSVGADVVLAPVDSAGVLRFDAYAAAVDHTTAVVSVIWANNEVGALQPVVDAAARAREQGAVMHSDAVQAVGHLPVDFAASGLDLMTFTAHKLGGPTGVGALVARRGVTVAAVQHGGGQERDIRSGTLDVAAIAGFAAAVEVAVDGLPQERQRVAALRADLARAVMAAVPDAQVHGPRDETARLPGVLNVGFPGTSADSVLMLLDAAGVDCSAGSACAAGLAQPSHVLTAMGLTEAEARATVRFSLGWSSTPADVAALAGVLPEVVQRARRAAAYV